MTDGQTAIVWYYTIPQCPPT